MANNKDGAISLSVKHDRNIINNQAMCIAWTLAHKTIQT